MQPFAQDIGEGETLLRRLHPLVKLLVATLACVAAFFFRDWRVPAAIAAAAALLHLGGVAPGRLRAVLKTFPLFVGIVVLANVFLVRHPGPWWNGAAAGLVQSLRIVALMLAANLFLATTDPLDLSDALLGALRPLGRAGLRPGAAVLMAMLVMSFVPLMIEEARRLELAQAVRCGFPKRGPAALRSVVPLVAPLFVGALRRADEIDMALRARGFRLDAPRTTLANTAPGAADYAVAAASLAAFIAGIYAQY